MPTKHPRPKRSSAGGSPPLLASGIGVFIQESIQTMLCFGENRERILIWQLLWTCLSWYHHGHFAGHPWFIRWIIGSI